MQRLVEDVVAGRDDDGAGGFEGRGQVAVEELGLDLVGDQQEQDVGDGGGVREVGG